MESKWKENLYDLLGAQNKVLVSGSDHLWNSAM